MISQNLNIGSQILQKYDYGYGKVDLATGAIDVTKNNGQLGSIDSYIGTTKQFQQRFDYDSIGRLAESREYRSGNNSNLTYKQHFDFDRFGNMYRKAAQNGTAGQSNPLPMTAIEDVDISKSSNRFTTNTTYNEAGMVISDNKFRSMNFSYDANGRQVNATNATNAINAQTVYDALGNRVATKINDSWQFVIYDAFVKLVAEYGTQGEGNGGVSYVLQDWQGSVRASVNNNGFIQARFDFTAFGEEISLGIGTRSIEQGYSGDATSRNGYGLTEKDSSGLNHTWFRKQEQRAGRWTSPDPYKGSMNLGNPQSFNRYSYVENEPTNFVDPSGLLLAITRCTTYTTGSQVCIDGVCGDITDETKTICTTEFINIGGGQGWNPGTGHGTHGDPGGGGGGGVTNVIGNENPNKVVQDAVYDRCMAGTLFGTGQGHDGIAGKYTYKLSLKFGKATAILGGTVVASLIVGIIAGTITAGNIGVALGAAGVTLTVGAITAGVGLVFDVQELNYDFRQDTQKAHSVCSKEAYGKATEFSSSRINKILPSGVPFF